MPHDDLPVHVLHQCLGAAQSSYGQQQCQAAWHTLGAFMLVGQTRTVYVQVADVSHVLQSMISVNSVLCCSPAQLPCPSMRLGSARVEPTA